MRHVVDDQQVVVHAEPDPTSSPDADGSKLLSEAPAGEDMQNAVPDGFGGTLVTWINRCRGTLDIYVQHLAAGGEPLWGSGGVPVCTGAGNHYQPKVAGDGAGGAYVVWTDDRTATAQIYGQHVSASGVAQWATDGQVVVSGGAISVLNPDVAGDGTGGALVTCWGVTAAANHWVFVQRVNGSGAVQWGTSGTMVTDGPYRNLNPKVVSDGAGGALATFAHEVTPGQWGIVGARVNGSGTELWGSVLTSVASVNGEPVMVGDGAGGAVVGFARYNGADFDIGVLKVDGNGTVAWERAACGAAGHQYISFIYEPPTVGNQEWLTNAMAGDGAGGVYLTSAEFRNGPDADVYVQHMSGAGVAQWGADGVAVATGSGNQWRSVVAGTGRAGWWWRGWTKRERSGWWRSGWMGAGYCGGARESW